MRAPCRVAPDGPPEPLKSWRRRTTRSSSGGSPPSARRGGSTRAARLLRDALPTASSRPRRSTAPAGSSRRCPRPERQQCRGQGPPRITLLGQCTTPWIASPLAGGPSRGGGGRRPTCRRGIRDNSPPGTPSASESASPRPDVAGRLPGGQRAPRPGRGIGTGRSRTKGVKFRAAGVGARLRAGSGARLVQVGLRLGHARRRHHAVAGRSRGPNGLRPRAEHGAARRALPEGPFHLRPRRRLRHLRPRFSSTVITCWLTGRSSRSAIAGHRSSWPGTSGRASGRWTSGPKKALRRPRQHAPGGVVGETARSGIGLEIGDSSRARRSAAFQEYRQGAG